MITSELNEVVPNYGFEIKHYMRNAYSAIEQFERYNRNKKHFVSKDLTDRGVRYSLIKELRDIGYIEVYDRKTKQKIVDKGFSSKRSIQEIETGKIVQSVHDMKNGLTYQMIEGEAIEVEYFVYKVRFNGFEDYRKAYIEGYKKVLIELAYM